jgi:hypothetical protein
VPLSPKLAAKFRDAKERYHAKDHFLDARKMIRHSDLDHEGYLHLMGLAP